jgi:hypothetical protein
MHQGNVMGIMHGLLLARYKAVEDVLDFAKDVNEQQLRLRQSHADIYNLDVHCGVIAFNLRTISRKIDELVTALHRNAGKGTAVQFSVSERTVSLQEALHEYNAATACRDPWEISLQAAMNCLELAFDCLESIENDIYAYERKQS